VLWTNSANLRKRARTSPRSTRAKSGRRAEQETFGEVATGRVPDREQTIRRRCHCVLRIRKRLAQRRGRFGKRSTRGVPRKVGGQNRRGLTAKEHGPGEPASHGYRVRAPQRSTEYDEAGHGAGQQIVPCRRQPSAQTDQPVRGSFEARVTTKRSHQHVPSLRQPTGSRVMWVRPGRHCRPHFVQPCGKCSRLQLGQPRDGIPPAPGNHPDRSHPNATAADLKRISGCVPNHRGVIGSRERHGVGQPHPAGADQRYDTTGRPQVDRHWERTDQVGLTGRPV
jgi:hypothetical protein